MALPERIAYHFWSPTCGPCIYFIGVNTKDDPQGIAEKFGVTHVPTFVILKNGEEIGRYTGSQASMFFTLCRKLMAS